MRNSSFSGFQSVKFQRLKHRFLHEPLKPETMKSFLQQTHPFQTFVNQFYNNMGKLKFLLPLFVGFATMAFAQDAPQNAQPGKCYAKCLIPDTYDNVTEQVLVKAASKKTIAIPATYETTTEQVEVKGASKRVIAVPATYETTTEQMLVKAASKRLVPVPAQYETVDERIMVKPESKRVTSVPAEYETVTERVMTKAESKRLVEVPAVYESVTESYILEPAYTKIDVLQPRYETTTERLETKPASTKWVKKRADANCLSANPDDCLVWCLVETPAEYQTITKRVNKGCDASGVADAGCTKTTEVAAKMGTRSVRKVKTAAGTREEAIPAEFKTMTVRKVKTPATTSEVVIPAEYATVKKQVLKTPATVREEDVPAEYATVSKQMVKSPATFREEMVPAEFKTQTNRVVKAAASTRSEDIPAEYTTITKRKLVKPGGFTEWREVLCGEKVTGYTVRQIQAALIKAGYDPGPTDNVMGARTKAALTKFQKDKGLPLGNLDMETLKALGVNY